MKKIFRIVAVFLTVAICTVLSVPVFATEDVKMYTIDSYNYPVVPGTEEWDDLGTFSQRLAVCRIPQETLSAMTTDALVDAVVNFPFLINLLVYNSYSEGFHNLLNQCDALGELLTRPDGADALARIYISLTEELGSKASTANVDVMPKEGLYPGLLEIILGQPEVYNNMSSQYQYATESAAATYNDNNVSFLDVSIAENADEITRATTVKTPNGSTVDWIDYSSETQWTSAEKSALNDQVEALYTIISIVRDPNKYYNCHSYAWYSTSSTNKVWIPDPAIYMTDGSYSKRSSAAASNKVFIKNNGTETSEITGRILGNHSGIVKRVSGSTIILTSKWGQLGLYTHNAYNSPYSGDHTDYSYWN